MNELIKEVALQAAQVLVPLLSTVLAIAISAALVLVLKRLGIDVSAKEAARLREEVEDVVEAVEEIAAANKKTGVVLESEEKLAIAIGKVQVKFPKVPESKIRDVIHAVLPRVGLGARGKLGLPSGFRL